MIGELSFEASELGFAPGDWPETFLNGNETFHLTCVCHRDGEVEYAVYACPETARSAVVFND